MVVVFRSADFVVHVVYSIFYILTFRVSRFTFHVRLEGDEEEAERMEERHR